MVEVDGVWIFRFPLRPEVERMVARELRLLPALAKALPVAIPQLDFVAEEGVGYRKLAGREVGREDLSDALARQLGRFLSRLHRFPPERAARLGTIVEDVGALCATLGERVLPLLGADRAHGERLLREAAALRFEPALVHGDLGPEHILVHDGAVSGIVDWSDARIGDPALDFAWLLNGTDTEFARALLTHYRRDDATLAQRALVRHRLGPWHEVLYGLDAGRQEHVDSGLTALRSRLPTRDRPS